MTVQQNNIVVIKVGGALLESKDAAIRFFQQLNDLKDIQPVVVHGGGTQVQSLLAELGLTSEKRHGVRVTPMDHVPYVTGVLAGTVNKQLVAYAQSVGCRAVGLSIADGQLVQSKIADPELGQVGLPTSANIQLITDLLASQWLPLVASIGADEQGELLNVNADHAAAALASGLQCPLVLLSDVAAVLDKDLNRIPEINPKSLSALIQDNTIRDGMRVKVESAMQTANDTGKAVTIASWKDDIANIISGELGTKLTIQSSVVQSSKQKEDTTND
jgi:acetylglutamate kinase